MCWIVHRLWPLNNSNSNTNAESKNKLDLEYLAYRSLLLCIRKFIDIYRGIGVRRVYKSEYEDAPRGITSLNVWKGKIEYTNWIYDENFRWKRDFDNRTPSGFYYSGKKYDEGKRDIKIVIPSIARAIALDKSFRELYKKAQKEVNIRNAEADWKDRLER